MYVNPNFTSKKALKEAIKAKTHIEVYQPNDMFGTPIPSNGLIQLEGPHYPKPHRWYGQGTMKDGKLVKVT